MNIETLRNYCLSLPSVTEEVKWDSDLSFSIGGKVFCVTSADVESGVSFKVKEELFRELTQREGIIPAPYMARHMWVFVLDFNWLTDEEWERLILDSYELVKEKLSKKVQTQL